MFSSISHSDGGWEAKSVSPFAFTVSHESSSIWHTLSCTPTHVNTHMTCNFLPNLERILWEKTKPTNSMSLMYNIIISSWSASVGTNMMAGERNRKLKQLCLSCCRCTEVPGPDRGFNFPRWEVSNDLFGRSISPFSILLCLAAFTFSFPKTWQRWAVPPCRPASVFSPAPPARGLKRSKQNIEELGQKMLSKCTFPSKSIHIDYNFFTLHP